MEKQSALYMQLADELRKMIEGSIFKPGDRLPSVRAMSRAKGLSIPTATAAYHHLEDRNLIHARPKSGYFVSRPGGAHPGPGNADLIERTLDVENATRFDAAMQDDAFYPVHRLSQIMSVLLRQDPGMLGRSTLALGDAGLRRELARRLVNWSCRIDPEELVVTNGGLEAINLCLRAITRPGDAVAVESLAYYGFLNLIESCGLRAVPVAGDPRRGMDMDGLQRVLAREPVKACLMSTTVSNPLGATLPLEDKRRLVSLLASHGVPLIEDATFADLHFQGPQPAAQSLDEDRNVILCASLTKTLAPGFRLGWVHPGRFLKPICSLKRILSGDQPEILQRTMGIYLENGGYERHLRKSRHELRIRMGETIEAITRWFPAGTRLTAPTGGYLLWVELPWAVDPDLLQTSASRLMLRIAPGRIFSAAGTSDRQFRLNFAQADTKRLLENLRAFGSVIRPDASRG